MKKLLTKDLSKPRSRRLRKKLRTAEFQELGVEVDASFPVEKADLDTTVDEWIDFVESNGWNFGGGIGDGRLSGFVAMRGSSLRHSDRALIREWLSCKLGADNVEVGSLRDCWHGG